MAMNKTQLTDTAIAHEERLVKLEGDVQKLQKASRAQDEKTAFAAAFAEETIKAYASGSPRDCYARAPQTNWGGSASGPRYTQFPLPRGGCYMLPGSYTAEQKDALGVFFEKYSWALDAKDKLDEANEQLASMGRGELEHDLRDLKERLEARDALLATARTEITTLKRAHQNQADSLKNIFALGEPFANAAKARQLEELCKQQEEQLQSMHRQHRGEVVVLRTAIKNALTWLGRNKPINTLNLRDVETAIKELNRAVER